MKIEEGDLVYLDKHRLLCGNSLKYSVLKKLLGDKKVSMLFTDPPYNISYVPEDRPIGGRRRSKNKLGGIIGDTNFDFNKFFKILEIGFIKGAIYVCGSTKNYCDVYKWMTNFFDREPIVIVWNKNNYSIGRRDYHRQHEFLFYSWFKEKVWNGDKERNQSDVWNVKRVPSTKYIHPTQKPVILVKKAILNSSNKGEIVLDLFGGSGSTLIAAESSGRICYTVELDPHYCEKMVERWEAFTGKKAVKV